ncbi:MAG: hypothetical protein R6W31_08525 [Bacteroidales bacterium]
MQEVKKIALYFTLTLFFIFLINIAFAPLHKMRDFENQVNADSLFLEKYDPIYNHPEMRLLVKEKTYKEALLKLAGSDSIQLVIDLSDSTVSLSIKGVVIHQTKVRSLERDKIFSNMPLNQQVKLFSQPLLIQSQYATIVKEPIVIRQAPKDTLEAALNAWQPDTLIQNPAFLILSAEYGIHLIFEQEDNPTYRDRWKRFGFYNRLRIRSSIQSLSNSIRFRKQEYPPTITVKMPADDLRAIYRALPQSTFVVVNL